MRAFVSFLVIAIVGTGLGIGSAYHAIGAGFGADTVSTVSWKGWSSAGAADADPYTRAGASRVRDLIMAPGQGMTLVAEADSEGRPLVGTCVYRIEGRTPAAQWWTLSVYDRDARRPMANPARRFDFTSSEITRDAAGGFEIVMAADAHPGNHLPVARDARLMLMLRLYEKPVTLTGGIDGASLPAIVRERCG